MRAVVVEQFGELPTVAEVPSPRCPEAGVLVAVEATGVCRSDWHAWMGHDPSVRLPHVPGHELAGTVAEVGPAVRRYRAGMRVTVPFATGCGTCPTCLAGATNVCPRQRQPGFTHWGSFAGLVAVDWADVNLVELPESVGAVAAAALGCRFATAYRAVRALAAVRPGEWLAVFGCGGVGLAAVEIAVGAGARVAAVDPEPAARELATALGAELALDAGAPDLVARLVEGTGGGPHASLDAIGRGATVAAALASLRPRGRHVQVGLLLGDEAVPRVDLGVAVARELVLLGGHGMAASDYPALLAEVVDGRLDPGRLVTRTVPLDGAPAALASLGSPGQAGTTVVEPGPTAG